MILPSLWFFCHPKGLIILFYLKSKLLKDIADIIISGCKYDLNGTAKSTYTTKSANAKFLNNELFVKK